jgi:5-methylcytosine-specific restriction protein A
VKLLNLYQSQGSKVAMINVKDLLVSISNKYGYEVYVDETTELSTKDLIIRFRIESSKDTFHLQISRTWKTTRIEFVPGKFASKVVDFLCREVIAHKFELQNILYSPEAKLSDFALEIDSKSFAEIDELTNDLHSMNLYVESMTPESSVEHGLLNEIEAHLLEVAISVVVVLLPRPINSYSNPDEVIGFPEGATESVLVNRYERDPRNRAAAIAIHGYRCLACDFDFKSRYGELGQEFIIVHHVVPVSQIGPDYVVNPAIDLVTLCANCHAMIHRQDPPLSLNQLREIVQGGRKY